MVVKCNILVFDDCLHQLDNANFIIALKRLHQIIPKEHIILVNSCVSVPGAETYRETGIGMFRSSSLIINLFRRANYACVITSIVRRYGKAAPHQFFAFMPVYGMSANSRNSHPRVQQPIFMPQLDCKHRSTCTHYSSSSGVYFRDNVELQALGHSVHAP